MPEADGPEQISLLQVTALKVSLDGGNMGQSIMHRYDEWIVGVLSCDDRVVITGTARVIGYSGG